MLGMQTGRILFFLGLLSLQGRTVRTELDVACYGNDQSHQCSEHNFQCINGTISIIAGFRGFLPKYELCYAERPTCRFVEECCRPFFGDCNELYTYDAYFELWEKCQGKQTCQYRVPYQQRRKCAWYFTYASGYSVIDYFCKPNSIKGESAGEETTLSPGIEANITFPSVSFGFSRGIVGEATETPADDSDNATAGKVGGAVAATVLVVAVVAVAVFLAVRRKRRQKRQGKSSSESVTYSPGLNSSSPEEGGSTPAVSGASGGRMTGVAPGKPACFPVHGEAGSSEDLGSDYSHPHQKNTSSASHDITYGHLAGGGDVTDYGYDHVAHGKPAVTSSRVINNTYDTAGPSTQGNSEEDHYNVTTDAPHRRRDVINNEYDKTQFAPTPSPDKR